MSDTRPTAPAVIDRSDRPGHVGLLIAIAGVLISVVAGLSLLSSETAQPFLLAVLALLAMAGIFFVFALAVGALRFGTTGMRNDVTKAISDEAPEAMLVADAQGRVVYANARYLDLAGAGSPSDLRTIDRLFTGGPDVSEAVYRLSQAAREGRVATEELRLSPALEGGREFGWYRVRVRPLPAAGRTASLWTIVDLTFERERQENVFQELQHAIDYLDHAPAGFFSVTPDGSVVYMNATLAAWLDHDLAKVGPGGLKLADIMPASVVALLARMDGKPGEARTETLDLDLARRGGKSLPVQLHHRIAFGADGKPGPSRTLVLNRSGLDAAGEGERAEARFARFFNAIPLAIATLDRQKRILRSNAAFLRLFGNPSRTGASGPAAVLDYIAQGDRARLEEAAGAALAGQAETAPLDVGLAQGGRQARLWLSQTRDAGEDDSETLVLYGLDTTEQRQLEQQFAQAQKMQAVGQLAGGVAHDFNNVLQAIIGYSDLLIAAHRPSDPSFQDIMQIKQNANRAAALVRQLLAFSRRQTLRPEVIKLGDTLSDLSLLLKRLLGERVQLEQRQGRDLWPVRADVNQLEQVVINLAVNARDAMPEGGTVTISTANVEAAEVATIDLAGLPATDHVRISVGDTGTGIPPELLDKIFEPFFTTKELGKGTGLGLSTVFGIVKQSGGSVYVDSTPGVGTTFHIYLPRHVPEAEPAPEAQPEPAPGATVKPAEPAPRAPDLTGHGTILLVEDEDAVRAVNSRALTARGYTVLEAASGIEAIEVFEGADEHVDLVVSDVMMPEMDGPTLLVELRRRDPNVRFVFVSGYAEDAFDKHLPEGDRPDFLPKPFSLKQLVETVKTAIGR